MVHGCFWHGHKRCSRGKRPTSNVQFWDAKLDANADRDRHVKRRLRKLGWSVLVVWECELRKPERLLAKLKRFLSREAGM